ncbi:glycosyltransferase [Flavobacterium degerlachei]|jgi:glycosyltransferase involved in cell wall biosynthesis|uniref:Glycosyltransferase involved in cell wall bisynthesis n=1 Tax=Flavobacterium degerlachei TaxID=229203 RepID=A0A1H2YF98_9FLAO|nr:glycosyltransferase [Flavobacterium degerlachei]SDX03872.1 Glycosyltransferase involved in cell wall bisynthesis [Flavobacterium degerlachei]
MKIAVITAFPPSKVTLNEYGYHLVKNFAQKIEVSEVILLSDKTAGPKDLDFENSHKVKVNECWEFNSYSNIVSISAAIRMEKPDAVLINLQFMKFGDKKVPAALGLMIPMVLRNNSVPTVSLLHNILEQVDLESAGFTDNKLAQKFYNFVGTTLTRFILRSDVVAVTINKYVEVLEKKYKVKNVKVIPHGTFDSIDEPSFELAPGPKQIMAFGKFGTYKKVEILIEAAILIRQRSAEKIEVVIAGTDSPNTPGYLAGVQEKYKDVEGIRFTGYVEEKDVPVIFGDSTVVAFPYTSTTGSSGVLHQAGSYGKAVVMPDLGDLALLVEEEGYKGEFFDPESAESLAQAIEKIINNDDNRKAIAMQNFKAASALSMDKITDMYMDTFKKIIQSKK